MLEQASSKKEGQEKVKQFAAENEALLKAPLPEMTEADRATMETTARLTDLSSAEDAWQRMIDGGRVTRS